MIIDANAFIGKWPYWPVEVSTPQDLLTTLGAVDVQRAAICSTRSVFVNWEDGNCESEAAASFAPELIPFACLGTQELSHAYTSRPYDFGGYAARGFKGLRLYPQHHSYHLLYASFVDEILEDAAARQWPVVLPLRIIMNWGMPSIDPSILHAIVTRHPRVVWILAGINYLFELQMATSLLRTNPNVYLETSCVMGFAAIEKTVQACGSSQILFGSGAPLQHAGAGLGKILHARISDQAREDILGQNFQRILAHLDPGERITT